MMERKFLYRGLYGDWERESLKIWAALAQRATTIVDVGANTGVYSLVAQNNNPAACVVAIEPVEQNFDVLVRNIVANSFAIRAQKMAISDADRMATMYVLRDRINYMSAVDDNRYADHPEIQGSSEIVEVKVQARPFSHVMEHFALQGLDLVKIDVESHEQAVIRSMMPYIERFRPAMLVEIIGDENATWLQAYFGCLGYHFVSISEVGKSVVVERLWDNDHHNFLLCDDQAIAYLRGKDLLA